MKKLEQEYKAYITRWYREHIGPEYDGMKPASYEEWYNNDRLITVSDPQWDDIDDTDRCISYNDGESYDGMEPDGGEFDA